MNILISPREKIILFPRFIFTRVEFAYSFVKHLKFPYKTIIVRVNLTF